MMQTVNQPLGHYVGSRSITGSLTCYADGTADHSVDLFEDLQEASVFDAVNAYQLRVFLGGKASANAPTAPGALFLMPAAHIDIPVHNIEDVVSFEIGFTALASDSVTTTNATTGATTITDATSTNSLSKTNELVVIMEGV